MKAVAGLIVAAAVSGLVQPADHVFRSRTVVTEMDVDVRSADGTRVTGLTAADFEVLGWRTAREGPGGDESMPEAIGCRRNRRRDAIVVVNVARLVAARRLVGASGRRPYPTRCELVWR